jgi:hypothetical protein
LLASFALMGARLAPQAGARWAFLVIAAHCLAFALLWLAAGLRLGLAPRSDEGDGNRKDAKDAKGE